MASPRFVHDAVVVAAPGVTPCHQTAGLAQKPILPASLPARSPTAPAGFQGLPLGQVFQQEEDLVLEENGCSGVSGRLLHGPGQPQPVMSDALSIRELLAVFSVRFGTSASSARVFTHPPTPI